MRLDKDFAFDISRHILEASSDALLIGDYPAFRDQVALPYRLEMELMRRVYHSDAELKPLFDAAHRHMAKKQVTLLDRLCVAAEVHEQDTIRATFETRMISHGQLIEEPYPAYVEIMLEPDQTWKVRNAIYYMPRDSAYQSALLR